MNDQDQKAVSELLEAMPNGPSKEEWSALLAQGKLVSFQAGVVIAESARPPAAVFVLVRGRARLLLPAEVSKEPLSIRLLAPGDLVGADSHRDGVPLEDVLASTACVALEVQPDRFFAWLKTLSNDWTDRVSEAELAHCLARVQGREVVEPRAFRDIVRDLVGKSRTRRGPGDEEGVWFTPSAEPGLPRAAADIPPNVRAIGLLKADWDGLVRAHAPQKEKPAGDWIDAVTPHRRDFPQDSAAPGVPAAISCFKMVSDYFQAPFREATVHRILTSKFSEEQTPDMFTMGAVCEVLGFHGQLVSVSRSQMAAADPPGIMIWQGQPAVLFEATSSKITLVSPVYGRKDIPREDWETQLPPQSEVLMLASVPQSAEARKFGFRWFLPALKQYRKVLIEVFLASFFVQLFTLSNPIVTQVIVDKVLVQNSPGTLHILGILSIVLAVAGTVTTMLRTYLFVDTTNRIDLGLGAKVVDRLYRLTLGYFHRRPVGEVTSRLFELENIRSFLTGTALTVILDGIFSVIYVAIMLFYNVTLTVVALSALPILAALTFFIAPIFRLQIRQRAVENAATQAYLVETLTGVQTVKAQNLEQRVRWEWQERYARFVAASFRSTITSTTFQNLVSLLSKLSDLAVLWYGAYLVLDGRLTLGQLIAFRIIAGYVTNPLLRLIQSYQSFQEVGLAIERLGDVMDSKTEQDEVRARDIPMPSVAGAVSYEDITFRYLEHQPPQLRNVSFDVPAGSFVGVVGESGSGKSTLMKLLPRLYEAESGRITVDGFDVAKVELYSLRRQIATVLQDTLLFDVSVEENIAVGDPAASPEEIIRAARIARAHDFIMGLPDGYRTKVGEQGRGLSGGQRQRVALARAVLQKPRLLVLDEATSALDFPTEKIVIEQLLKEFSNLTVFFVTHRLRSVESADRILVMDQGVIAEQGSHAELMARRGLYYTLNLHQGSP